MSDTTYSFRPNTVERIRPKQAEPDVPDEDDWEEPTTEVTRLREEMEQSLKKSESRLSGVAKKIEELRRWASQPPGFEGA